MNLHVLLVTVLLFINNDLTDLSIITSYPYKSGPMSSSALATFRLSK
jgi:hypothetical protein